MSRKPASMVLLGFLCSGCVNSQSGPQYVSPDQVSIDTERCQVVSGPGTDAFINCLMSLGLDRETATRVTSEAFFQ